jgi:dipeptidase E
VLPPHRHGYVARFYRAFAALDCRPTDLQLFTRTVGDLEAFVLAQDVVYVGGGNTASMLAPLHDGLGLLPGSACPHFDGEEQRRPAFRRLVAAGELADGWAADDGVDERAFPARYLGA